MRNILVAIVLLAVGVSVPVCILVLRALDSAAVEEESRHRSVADRAFDEMEGALSQFLAEEELRPFGEYRFYEDLSPTSPLNRRRSPLSRPPERPFVIGYFQIEPDGSLGTPRRPRDTGRAEQLGDFQPTPELDQLEAKLRTAWTTAQLGATPSFEPPRARPGRAAARFRSEPAPTQAFSKSESGTRSDEAASTTAGNIELQRFAEASAERPAVGERLEQKSNRAGTSDEEDEAADSSDADDTYDTYDILRSFNSAGERRAQRKQKVRVERAPLQLAAKAYSIPDPTRVEELEETTVAESVARQGWLSKDDRFASSDSIPGTRPEALPETPQTIASLPPVPQLREAKRAGDRPASASPSAAHARTPAPPAAAIAEPETLRVALDPMIGRPPDADTLLLYRTVVAGEQGYRQGLLVDWRGLGSWLEREVIAPSRISSASTVAFFGADRADSAEPARNRASAYVYRHEFAEPFDAFGVELALEPLPGGRGTGTIHALAALLAIVGAGGLYALYRMVSVVVEFAERRNRFVAAVSHELKTPLTSIRMYGEMLRDGIVADDSKRSEYYTTITDESERLSRLIDNVLDFSRLEKGERNLRPQDGALWPVILEAVEKLRPHAESQGFALVPTSDAPLPEARFDRDVVTQVVFNLIDNALKYAAAAERREVAIECRERANAVELSVRDWGPGVPRNDRSRIFEPFFRREDELTRTTKGTGIGLALVKELVEAMQGEVEATTPEDGGLRVTVRFPLAPKRIDVPAAPQ